VSTGPGTAPAGIGAASRREPVVTGPGDDVRPVPDVVAPPPHHPRFPLMDGMRAIAVLSVVLVHSAGAGGALTPSVGGRLLAHLNIGVTLFFLISGFLLYRPFIAHRAGGASAPATGDYAKRRFLRVYPAYWVAVTVLVIAPGLTAVVEGDWLPMYALVHTLPVYDGPGCTPSTDCGLAPTWSLVVEVSFYALLPLYVLCVGRLTRGLPVRRWMWTELFVLAAVSVLSVGLLFGTWAPTHPAGQFALVDQVPSWFGDSAFGYAFWFALGMGMAVVSARYHTDDRAPWLIRAVKDHPGICWLLALAGYALLSAWLPPSPFFLQNTRALTVHLAFGVIAVLLLAPAVFGDPSRGFPRRLLAHPLVAWLGLVSYGVFLWHFAVTRELGRAGAGESFAVVLAGALAISILCAAASYYFVERPILRLKYRRLRDLPLVWRRV
jgi:peptidoglycan/LPS O-acetylase OafA/YrhL